MIPGVIGSDGNAVNAQPLSSPNFGSRGRDAEHAEEETVSGIIADIKEVIDSEERNDMDGNIVTNIRSGERRYDCFRDMSRKYRKLDIPEGIPRGVKIIKRRDQKKTNGLDTSDLMETISFAMG